MQPQKPPSLEPLEPRLLLNADLAGIRPILAYDVPSSEHAIYVDLTEQNQGIQESDPSLVLAYIASPHNPNPTDLEEPEVSTSDEPAEDHLTELLLAETAQPVDAELGATGILAGTPVGQAESSIQIAAEPDESVTPLRGQSAGLIVGSQQEAISISEASSIEIRGPPQGEASPVTCLRDLAYKEEVQASILVQDEGVSSPQGVVAPVLPGLELVDSDPSNLQGQVVYLDFDGADDVIYSGPVTIGPFDVPAFQPPAELARQEQAIITELLANLQDTFAGSGVIFTTNLPEPGTEYSTIYVGGDDSAFSEYGSFLGLAEQVDVGNQDRYGDGLVFAANLAASTNAEDYASSLARLIAHEAGHLLGFAHDHQIGCGSVWLASDLVPSGVSGSSCASTVCAGTQATGDCGGSYSRSLYGLRKVASESVGPAAGKGIWVLNLGRTEGGDVSKILETLHSANVDWIAIKCGDSDSYWSTAPTSQTIAQFHDGGIRVLGWQYVYSYDKWNIPDVSEADVANRILDISGIDGLIVNAEQEYDEQGKGPIAEAYMQSIRNAHPEAFIAYSTFARIDSHPWFPYLEFGRYSNVAMPQDYWGERQITPQDEVGIQDAQWNKWYQIWADSGYGDSVKPIVPTGQAYGTVTASQIRDFCAEAQNCGYAGVSLFRYAQNGETDVMTDAMWDAYRTAFPSSDATPPIIHDFRIDEPHSVVFGSSFTIRCTVSDAGGSGLNRVELWRTNTYPSWPNEWEDRKSVSGNDPREVIFSDTPPLEGEWWYGIHVVDNEQDKAGEYTTEQDCGLTPISVTVTQPKPDLQGSTLDCPESLVAGQTFDITFSIDNDGDADAAGFDVDFYLSRDSNISTTDKYLGRHESPGLPAASRTIELTKSLVLPDAGDVFWNGDGTYHLGMVIDASNSVAESDETNNANRGDGHDWDAAHITGTSTTPPNQSPSVGSLGDGPDPVIQGNNLTLTANAVSDSDGTVVKVEFYRDANANGAIDVGTDVLLGTDTTSSGGWTWTGSTGAFPVGTNTYMARAQDDDSDWSNTAITTGTVVATPSTISVLADKDSMDVPEGLTATFRVKLSGRPPSDVVVSINRVSGEAEISIIEGATLTFTEADWSTYQTVTLLVELDPDSTDELATIECSSPGLTSCHVLVREQDNCALEIILSKTSLYVGEGSTATFGVRLSLQPDSDVVVTVGRVGGDSDILVSEGASLTFTPSNGKMYQTVTVSARKDPDTFDGVATIRCSASGLPSKDIMVTEEDNDTFLAPVHRFWSPVYSRHFYTTSKAERDKLIDNYSHVWTYENVAFHAFADDTEPDAAPVYRFWSAGSSAHFYTMSESEKAKLMDDYSHVWTYERIAFYAYAEGFQPAETQPVWRFWKQQGNTHFYTMDEDERDKLIALYPHVWTYEQISWYAYAP